MQRCGLHLLTTLGAECACIHETFSCCNSASVCDHYCSTFCQNLQRRVASLCLDCFSEHYYRLAASHAPPCLKIVPRELQPTNFDLVSCRPRRKRRHPCRSCDQPLLSSPFPPFARGTQVGFLAAYAVATDRYKARGHAMLPQLASVARLALVCLQCQPASLGREPGLSRLEIPTHQPSIAIGSPDCVRILPRRGAPKLGPSTQTRTWPKPIECQRGH